MPIRTHYDNLHISADADAETVKQAYRRLSKQYHPDLNPDPDAHRIMQLINQAYEVLSDPERRAEHDRWIAEQQARQKVAEVRITVQRQPAAAPAAGCSRRAYQAAKTLDGRAAGGGGGNGRRPAGVAVVAVLVG